MDIIRLSVGVLALGVASYTDLRTRRVPNRLWGFVMPFALALLALQPFMEDRPLDALVVPMTLIFVLPVFFEGGRRTDLSEHVLSYPIWVVFVVLSIATLVTLLLLGGDPRGLVVPGLLLLVYGMYIVGLLHGGGDAKAMIALVLLVPFPPLDWDPMIRTPSLFPFPIVVLTNSMILFLVIPVALFLLNLVRGDLGLPEMFFGYRMPLRKARREHVWPMERVVGDRVVLVLFPSRIEPDETYAQLARRGRDRIWVSPKFPFMVPLLMGFVAAFLLGDLMAALVLRGILGR